MGTMKLVTYNLEKKEAIISSSDSTFARVYLKLFGKTRDHIDYYMNGILAGGTEPIINCSMGCKELKCIAKGDEKCEYSLYPIQEETPKLIKDLPMSLENLSNISTSLFLRRDSFLKNLFDKQTISLSEGALVIEGTKGLLIPHYLFIIMCKAFSTNNEDEFNKILKLVAYEFIENLKISMNPTKMPSEPQLNNLLSNLNKFGFGHFHIRGYANRILLIENKNNPYPLDYKHIFGTQIKSVDIFSCYLLEALLKKYVNLNIKIEEKGCMVGSSQSCIFYVTFDN
jgi:hypothetical protein